MLNDKKYRDRCLWYENFCNIIDKYNGISVSTYAVWHDFLVWNWRKHVGLCSLNKWHIAYWERAATTKHSDKTNSRTRFKFCMDILGLQGWVSFLDTGTNEMVIEMWGIFYLGFECWQTSTFMKSSLSITPSTFLQYNLNVREAYILQCRSMHWSWL